MDINFRPCFSIDNVADQESADVIARLDSNNMKGTTDHSMLNELERFEQLHNEDNSELTSAWIIEGNPSTMQISPFNEKRPKKKGKPSVKGRKAQPKQDIKSLYNFRGGKI